MSPLQTPLTKPCEIEDFADGAIRDAIREVFPHEVAARGEAWPTGFEYRKHWEWSRHPALMLRHGDGYVWGSVHMALRKP